MHTTTVKAPMQAARVAAAFAKGVMPASRIGKGKRILYLNESKKK